MREPSALDFERSVIIPRARRPVLTFILLGLTAGIFALLTLLSQIQDIPYYSLLYIFGAKVNALIQSGEVWRLIAPIFLHVDIRHLLFNGYALYVLGSQVEIIYGRGRFAAIYFLAGILGNLASFAFNSRDSVGASGAIFGLFGALLFLGVEKPGVWKKYFRANILTAVGINIIYGLFNPQIDNFAHGGGLVAGFLACGMLRPAFQVEQAQQAQR
ncbi:MAG TPA: rhomboid family intramembrane serine protease, partial [Clostridiales bacterium]|nr:rhomboid family intramembrane serine protease [Clostridiales bacterium]